MKNKLLALGGIIAVIVFGFMILRDPGHIPLLDANRTMLAETEAQAYCAAPAHFEQWSQAEYDECLEESTRSTDVDIQAVLPAFCVGVSHAIPYTVDQCMTELLQYSIWPTQEPVVVGYAGIIWISDDWNKNFPYPLRRLGASEQDDSRTGDRDGIIREGENRP